MSDPAPVDRLGRHAVESPDADPSTNKSDYQQGNLLRLVMSKLDAIASIIWAKWGDTFLASLHQEALSAADGLALRAMNSDGGIRTLLLVCTTNRDYIQASEEALHLNMVSRPVDWQKYSVAEMIFKTEKSGGISHQEMRDGIGRASLVICATRSASVRTIETLFDLPE